MDSIYSKLGLTPEQLADTHRTQPATMQVGYFEQPGGDPIIGLSYMTDYKAEEEWGVGDLRKAITSDNSRRYQMVPEAADRIGVFKDVNALVLSTVALDSTTPIWGHHLEHTFIRSVPAYAVSFNMHVSWDSPMFGKWGANASTVPELRAKAKQVGIKPLPSRKADLIAALVQKDLENSTRTVWPAWFQNGRQLVLRADSGQVGDVVKLLSEAAQAGTLGIGNGSGPFSSGLFIYDTRDETQELKDQREADHDWYDARMAELEPVKKDLEENVLGFYFLGNPSILDTGDGRMSVRYWMNSHGTKLANDGRQISGWFTLEQLKDRSFIDIHNEKLEQRAA